MCREKWLFRPRQSPEDLVGQPEARCMSEVLAGPRDSSWAPENGADLEHSMSQVLSQLRV